MTDSPIFVAGLPRTGKTALRLAMGAHPRLSITRKTRMWTSFYGRFGDLSDPTALDDCLLEMLGDPGVARLLPDEAAIRDEFSGLDPTYAALFGVVHAQNARRLGKARWGDQMAGLEAFAEPIFETWPDARMIHMVRRPTEWVERRSQLRPGGVGSSLARWTSSARTAVDNHERWPERYLVLRFEALVAQPVATLQEVAGFVGEEFNFGIGQILVSALNVGATPPLSRPARRFVDERTRDLVTSLGYPPTDDLPERRGVTQGAADLWFGKRRRPEIVAMGA